MRKRGNYYILRIEEEFKEVGSVSKVRSNDYKRKVNGPCSSDKTSFYNTEVCSYADIELVPKNRTTGQGEISGRIENQKGLRR